MRHTTRCDNIVHLGHKIAVTDYRQSRPSSVREESSLVLVNIHIAIIIPLRVVASVKSGSGSYLFPVFHGLCLVEEGLRINFQILESYVGNASVTCRWLGLPAL